VENKHRQGRNARSKGFERDRGCRAREMPGYARHFFARKLVGRSKNLRVRNIAQSAWVLSPKGLLGNMDNRSGQGRGFRLKGIERDIGCRASKK
jgi:hypothetical protein